MANIVGKYGMDVMLPYMKTIAACYIDVYKRQYNFCAIEDVENTVRMAVEVIKGLNDERIRHLMHQDIL